MKRLLVPFVLLGVLVAAGCLSSQKMDQPEGREVTGLDKTLSTFAWMEKGDLVTFIVNTRAARYREDDGYIPFEFSIANTGLRSLNLTRESFELVDAEGNRYPAAGPRELLDGYEFLELDRSPALEELEGLVSQRFAAFTRYDSNFSPTRTAQRGVVWDNVTIPRYGYIIDWIYFPTPKTGVKGHRFDIFLSSPNLEDPVFVKFEIR